MPQTQLVLEPELVHAEGIFHHDALATIPTTDTLERMMEIQQWSMDRLYRLKARSTWMEKVLTWLCAHFGVQLPPPPTPHHPPALESEPEIELELRDK